MYLLFQYNWQVRDEWLEWCEQVDHQELVRKRVGGVGSILDTLVHIIDVEHSWINGLQEKQDYLYTVADYPTLPAIKELSNNCRREIEDFIKNWSADLETKPFGEFTYGEVMRHVIAHEIHHMGQLSIWAREMELKPISANFINRNIRFS